MNPMRQRGRKEQIESLLRGWHPSQDVSDVLDETKVKHAIGFVQHYDLYAFQVKNLLLEIIDQSSRRPDQDVDASAEAFALFVIAGAAVNEPQFETRCLAQHLGIAMNLNGQLTGRCQNDGTRIHPVA